MTTDDTLRLAPLDRRRFQEFEHLLSGKEFNGCYCTRWSGEEGWEERCSARPHENLERARARLAAGHRLGFLAIRDSDGAVVGWTGSGPKTEFPLLKTLPGSRTSASEPSVWSIGCLAIGRSYRGLGYAALIVRAVLDEARRAGARAVEAYPVEPAGADEAHRGDRALYERLGFQAAGQEKDGHRTVLRMERTL